MVEIESLLNPMSERQAEISLLNSPISIPDSNEAATPRKKVKLTKDAAIFTPGPIRGACRFPPDEYQDDELAAYHERFKVTPFGEIADYPRHIPYNSEKKSFWEKTNRGHLEVFQYTFKVPGDDHIYTMLWDYNIGLVRTTPLFKCTGYSKTTPAKMINRNEGLRNICHSITGGALVAQGYWIPHAAAKAIAATFCYQIRHALTPVFGHDFPSICIKPDDERFGDMVINPDIIRCCIEEAKRFRNEEESIDSPPPELSQIPTKSTLSKPRRDKSKPSRLRRKIEKTYGSPYTSSHASDTGSDGSYRMTSRTPEPIPRNIFTPINTPQQTPRSVPFLERRLQSSNEVFDFHHQIRSSPPMTPPSTATRNSSPAVSPKTNPRRLLNKGGDQEITNPIESNSKTQQRHDTEWLDRQISEDDQQAAYALLSMKFQTEHNLAKGLGIVLPIEENDNDASVSMLREKNDAF